MCERRDVFPSLFLFLLIATIMVTLSQILVVHHSNHQGNKPRDLKKIHELVKKLELCIESMLKKDVLPLEKYHNEFRALLYSSRIARLVNETKSTRNRFRVTKINEHSSKATRYTLNDDRKSRHLQNVRKISNANTDAEELIHVTHSNHNNGPGPGWFSDEKAVIKQHQHTGVIHSSDISGYISRYSDSIDPATRTEHNSPTRSQSMIQRKRRKTEVPPCPAVSEHLLGALKIDVNISLSNISRDGSADMLPGGAWKPRDCVARHRVAIVIPYRDRRHHLQVFLHYLLPVLKRQELDFRIFVVEQFGNKTFNKGRVMNAAYKEASKMADFQCFVFHDVDLLPEDDRNLYSCPKLPRHMSPAVDKFHYSLPYKKLVGGVFSIRTTQFQQVNGYSNLYWGWGAEDDDMSKRLDVMGLNITRPPFTIGRYKMMRHVQREQAPLKMKYYLLQTVGSRFRKDGLNSLEYKTVFINNTSLYTHIMVDVGDPPNSPFHWGQFH